MYRLTISKNRAQKLLDALPERSRRIVKEHLLRLQEDPYPGHGGDKKNASTWAKATSSTASTSGGVIPLFTAFWKRNRSFGSRIS